MAENTANRSVTVITHARFHCFHLAEQLQKAGRLAAIYSGYPRFKLKDTQVKPGLVRSFPWFMTPYMALPRFVPNPPQALMRELAWRNSQALSAHAARTLPECGLVTALSGAGLAVGRAIKARGGVHVCDRGSTHIDWQNRVLEEEYRALRLPWDGIDPRVIAVERAEYELADAITVPSAVVERSFLAMGVPAAKLRRVPYGVDLSTFHPVAERAANFRVLFVGALSVRKGLHYLLDAFRRADLPGAELVLVGARTRDTEALLRRTPVERMRVLGPQPRAAVVEEMSRASVMVLPSIEEGLALVQAEALACGCPVIATTETGSEDLFEDGREGFIVPARDAAALADRMTRLHRDQALRQAMSEAALARVRSFGGWDQYGARMLGVFDALLDARAAAVRAQSAA